MPTRSNRLPHRAALAAAIWLTTTTPSLAQSVSCPTGDTVGDFIAGITRTYDDGDYAQTIDAIDRCVGELKRPSQAAQAFGLLAKSYIAQGQFPEAQEAVRELIKRDRNFVPPDSDPPPFADMVLRARLGRVRSVSKLDEDWREAPATVVVVTADDIVRRGYRDVEQILHDLPGFDISRGSGDLYATLSQRGYRSSATDRTLVLLDGVEQNDLHSNIAYISRQYPLTNIDRIEVIYGPASTIYGPNAFSGVINIITKLPEAIAERGRHAARVLAGGGAFGTAFGEGTYAGQSADGAIGWSVTARRYRSNEPDFLPSEHRRWRKPFPEAFDDAGYEQALALEGKTLDKYLCARLANETVGYVLDHPERCAEPTAAAPRLMEALAVTTDPLVERRDINNDGYLDIVPTRLGVNRAIALDKAMWAAQVGARTLSYSDPATNSFVSGKVTLSNFSMGFQTWTNTEGTTPWYGEWARGTGGTWVPHQTSIFATYAMPVANNLELNMLVRYKNDQIDDESVIPLMATYASGYLGILNLLDSTPSEFRTLRVDQVSTQFRAEVTAIYERSNRWKAIFGADIRDGSSQAGYFFETSAPLFSFDLDSTPEEIKATDVGLFTQLSYSLRRRLNLVLGVRYDGNETRENERVVVRIPGADAPTEVAVEDFGKFISPRAAVVATLGRSRWRYLDRVPGQIILKGIFSKASQQPSNFQRFASEPYVREFPSPALTRERATNAEYSVSWEPNASVRLDVGQYWIKYSDVLHTAVRVNPCCTPARTGQFDSVGGFHITGVQGTLSATWHNSGMYANYTYTEGLNSERLKDRFGDTFFVGGREVEREPIADIARHKFNVGAHARLWRGFDSSLRLNYVGRRPTGAGSVRETALDPYAVLHGTVGYRFEAQGTTVQMGFNNLGPRYSDPGVRSASTFGFTGTIPQPGVSLFAHLIWDVDFSTSRNQPSRP